MAMGGYVNISEQLYNSHFDALDKWVKDKMDHEVVYGVAKSDGKRIQFMDCMEMYESEEYQKELDRIIKSNRNT